MNKEIGKSAMVKEGTSEKKLTGSGVSRTRYIAVVGMLSAISYVLMFLEFPLPMLIPEFVKMDFSDLPALIAAFSLGPVAGVLVGLIKNLLHLFNTHSGGVGELANFMLCASFVWTAGMIYKFKKNRKTAIAAVFFSAVVMALISVPVNYFITYPVYQNFMPIEAIIAMYQKINPSVNGLLECLVVFNMPFTLGKALASAIITIFVYKPLSPVIKGFDRN